VVDGERPLEFPDEILSFHREKAPHLYLTSQNILRAFQKNKSRYEFNPDLGKVADSTPLCFSNKECIWTKL
jgi:hypothetical protein